MQLYLGKLFKMACMTSSSPIFIATSGSNVQESGDNSPVLFQSSGQKTGALGKL